MPFQNNGWNQTRSELLMDIAATLADFTRKLDSCAQIPGYLCSTLGLDPITLAVVAENDGKPEVLMNACSRADCTSASDLLAIFEQTRPLSADAAPMLRPMIAIDRAQSTADAASPAAEPKFPRATVFSHALGEGHRMLLMVHQTPEGTHLPEGITEVLQVISQQLAKMLGCLVIWSAGPETLGAPFNTLTEREWNVLRNLDNEAGEKQLADKLGVSPHTLHSHIKSIYRKVGVQGRLPLLLRVEATLQSLRTERLNVRQQLRMSSPVTEPAIAIG